MTQAMYQDRAMEGTTGACTVRWTFKLIIIFYLYSTHYIDQWAMDRHDQQEQAQQVEGDAINYFLMYII